MNTGMKLELSGRLYTDPHVHTLNNKMITASGTCMPLHNQGMFTVSAGFGIFTFEKVLLWSPGWPQSQGHPPVLAISVLGFQV